MTEYEIDNDLTAEGVAERVSAWGDRAERILAALPPDAQILDVVWVVRLMRQFEAATVADLHAALAIYNAEEITREAAYEIGTGGADFEPLADLQSRWDRSPKESDTTR